MFVQCRAEVMRCLSEKVKNFLLQVLQSGVEERFVARLEALEKNGALHFYDLSDNGAILHNVVRRKKQPEVSSIYEFSVKSV